MADFNQSSLPARPSPSYSSPESVEVDDEYTSAQLGQWQQQLQTSPSLSSKSARPPLPMQKRRRVTRACDECRRKKIKCDGTQPCTHCSVYSYGCTYDQPSNRRRNPTPQYIEALENRLNRAEALLRKLLPNINMSDPNIDAVIREHRQAGILDGSILTSSVAFARKEEAAAGEYSQLRFMVEATGRLDRDESGNCEFHGRSSDTVFLHHFHEQFGGLLGRPSAKLFTEIPGSSMSPTVKGSPRSTADSTADSGTPKMMNLPSRDTAKTVCEAALSRAAALLRFVHQPTFYGILDRIYDIPAERFGDAEKSFLPLLYVTLAVGSLFCDELSKNPDGLEEAGYKDSINLGFKYFRNARSLIDITDCRSIMHLQAILFMILFLQSSANLSTCYSYIGIALRSALRMGLHRNLTEHFNPIERETRKRVFWVIRKLDTYVSAFLGFPELLSTDDIDQEFPIEVDDEFITNDTVLPMPGGKSLLFQASNAHTRLMLILAKVTKDIYPTKGLEKSIQGSFNFSYVISHSKIKEIEQDLTQWLEKLPIALRPGIEGEAGIIRIQQLLRLSYAHVQMMLYRPFLHYFSKKARATEEIDDRSFECASACVSVSRNIVHITTEMKKQGLLIGAYWFIMYTTFFAILSLVYFVVEHPGENGVFEILKDANSGKEALEGLARESEAADRCSALLKGLFENLPEELIDVNSPLTVTKKKRPAPFLPDAQNFDNSADLSIKPGGSGSMVTLAPRGTNIHVAVPIQRNNLNELTSDLYRLRSANISRLNVNVGFELMSPVNAPTTDPISIGYSANQQGFHRQQHPYAIPGLGVAIFPPADPFTYPDQPIMEFDAVEHNLSAMNPDKSQPLILSKEPNIDRVEVYDGLEGQLPGPIRPYLSQEPPNFDLQASMAENVIGSVCQDTGFRNVIPHEDMRRNFDVFSAEGDDWKMHADQIYGPYGQS